MRDRRPRSGGLDWARSPWQLLFLPAAVVIMFWPIITGQRYFFEDIVQQFYPSLSFLAYSLRSFRIPLWSPYVFCGIPYINDIQSQTFYPPNWLFTLFLGSDGRLSFLALELAIISHVLLAGYFMYLLGRELGLTLRPALFAGFCFMLSGFMILRTIHLGVIYTYIWFPLIFLLFRRSLHTGRLLPVLLAGLVFAVAACGGYPQTLLHMSYALGLYALFFIIRHWRQDPRVLLRSVAYLAVMVMVGLGVAAAQYLPSLNYVKYTVRASLSYHDLVDASLRPIQLLTLLAPKFFGSVTGNGTDTIQFWAGEHEYNYWETVIYFGILPLVLALFGLFDRRQNNRLFLLTLAALALLLALGRFTPLYRLALVVLPGFKRFRIPGRLSDLFTFGMCLLAGIGLEFFLRRGSEPSLRVLFRVLLGALGMAFLVWLLLVTGLLRGLFPAHAAWLNATRQWGLFLILLALGLGLVTYRRLRRTSPDVVFLAALGIVFIDLYLFGHSFNSTPEAPYPRSAEQLMIQDEQRQHPDQPFRVNSRIPGVGMLLGRNQGNLDRIELLEGYTPLGIARYAPFAVPTPTMLDLLNAKYRTRIDTANRRLVLAPNPTVLPRARMVYRYELARSDSHALQLVRAGNFDHRRVVILEQAPGFPSRGEPGALPLEPRPDRAGFETPEPPGSPGQGPGFPEGDSIAYQVDFISRTPDRLSLRVQTAETGILVLSEVYYPEWKAILDNRLVPIYPVDFALRGVTIPPGEHQLTMYYDPTQVRRGIIVSLVSLVLTLTLVTVLTIRRHPTIGGEKENIDIGPPGA